LKITTGSKIKTEAAGTKPKLTFLEMKTTSNGR
jgi:hypothetical protein